MTKELQLPNPATDRFQREDPVDTNTEVLETGSDPNVKRDSVVLEFSVMLTGSKEELAKAAEAFNTVIRAFYARSQDLGVAVGKSRGYMRALTKEENLTLKPRKYHFSEDGRHICDTQFVARKYLTTNREKVTCKLCLRRMGEGEG